MKKTLLKGLAVALFFATVACSSAWAESNFTITKADGTPAVVGTDYTTESSFITLKTNDLVLSGEFDLAVYLGDSGDSVDNYTFTLKDATITSDWWAGSLCYMNQSLNLVLEGTNRIVNTGSEGSAIYLYNGATNITFTGSGELYMTSQAVDYDNIVHSCLWIAPWYENTLSATAEGFTIKGSTTPNAEISTLADALIGTYKYSDSFSEEFEALGILIGEERCNTVWMKGSAFDPETDYVVVTYKEGSETKTATYKAADVEKVEWKKGADISK